MNLRIRSILLLLLSACATPEPSLKDQAAVPVGPLVAPKPVVVPAPMGLSPPAPFVVLPEEQILEPRPDTQVSEAEPSTEQEPGEHPKSVPDKGAPPALAPENRPECEPVPVTHRGGDALHDRCADEFPPNRFPGHDVLVSGKRFDALQVGVRVLWEIKTDRFDEYTPFLRNQVIKKQVPELLREREIAMACGYDFFVGVSSAAHQAALKTAARELKIVLTGC